MINCIDIHYRTLSANNARLYNSIKKKNHYTVTKLNLPDWPIGGRVCGGRYVVVVGGGGGRVGCGGRVGSGGGRVGSSGRSRVGKGSDGCGGDDDGDDVGGVADDVLADFVEPARRRNTAMGMNIILYVIVVCKRQMKELKCY